MATPGHIPSSPFEIIEPREDEEVLPPWTRGSLPPYEPGFRQRWRDRLDRYTPRLAFPVALWAGGLIAAALTIPIVLWVQNFIHRTKLVSDPDYWTKYAQKEDYDPCYYGCNDCLDTAYAYKACLRTAAILIDDSSITCDGTKIWNWADRYPEACLRARGEYYLQKELRALRNDLQFRLAYVGVPVVGGLVGGALVYQLWRKKTVGMRQRSDVAAVTWPGWKRREVRALRYQHTWRAFLLLLCGLPERGRAWPCHRGPAVTRYFSNDNGIIWTKAHSKLSDCQWYTTCRLLGSQPDDCKFPECANPKTGWWSDNCTVPGCVYMYNDCIQRVRVYKPPADIVDVIVPAIEHCGFSSEDRPDEDATGAPSLRLANPGLELM